MRPVNYKGFKLVVTSYEGWTMGEAIRISDDFVLADKCLYDYEQDRMMSDLETAVDAHCKEK